MLDFIVTVWLAVTVITLVINTLALLVTRKK